MSKIFANLGGNGGAVLAGGGMAAAIALGAYIGFGRSDVDTAALPQNAPQEAAETEQVTSSQPSAAAQRQNTPDTQEVESTPSASDAPQAPQFDELRRETDGTTIIAGRAEPLSEVSIIVDGQEVAIATADSSGGFATIAVLPPKDTAQVVSLSAKDGDEEVVASLDEIILAPTRGAPKPEVSRNAVEVEAEVDEQPTQQIAAASDQTPTEDVPVTQNTPATEEMAQQQVDVAKAVASEQSSPTQDTPAAIAVLKSDAEGVSLLNAPQPEAMTTVALDTIGYSRSGDVQLSGRAQPNTARVRVYLDNRSVVTLPVDAQGRWRGDLPDVDEGVYTLRVDEVSTAGDVSSRVETPFKREAASVLAQAAATDGPIKSVTVQTGATLWAIARDRYGDGTLFVRVFEANSDSIRNPDLIYPGQVFDLPN